MTKGRMEAFSDGVFAVIITIMVLDMKAPQGASLQSLRPVFPVFCSYVLSFVFMGIYWSNHHHLLQAARGVSGVVLWANLHLLFWLSLTPFATAWMGSTQFAKLPVAVYGLLLLGSAFAYYLLAQILIAHHGSDSRLAASIGSDRKGKFSLAIYVAAIALSFVSPWFSCACYVLVAIMWFLPDPRIEKSIAKPALANQALSEQAPLEGPN